VTVVDILSSEHEQVVFCHDAATGLRAVIALHSTALGPGLGGTRFYPYASEAEAVADVLNLARGMTYKNALAGLDHGGGKAVTACDVGTYVADMDVVARECAFVTGRSESDGGAGDSSVLTALGVFQGLRAAAAHAWGSTSLAGRRVGVAGVGKVGHLLVDHLREHGADVVVTDVDTAAVERVRAAHPAVEAVGSTAELLAQPLDAYAPCALGGALTDKVAASLTATVVCGAANNQLARPEVAEVLQRRGITYAPDFVVNSGGVIQVADERHGFSFERARARTMRIFETTAAVLAGAAETGEVPSVAAEHLAEQRIAAVSGLRRTWLPTG
jgi:valine dehydrogenase (NAD+)